MRKPFNTDSQGTPDHGLGIVSEVNRAKESMETENTRISQETVIAK
jgi:hypothetical protein